MLRSLIRRMVVVLCFVFVSFAASQAFPPLETFVATDSANLDSLAINQAAQRLKDKGVEPVVIFVEADVGQSLDDASQYFDSALEFYGLRQSDGSLQKNLLALFVGTNPLPESDDQRPIFIVYEDGLFPILEGVAGSKDVDTFIREDLMIPKLLEGNFTGAFTSVFESLGERLPTGEAETTESPINEPQVMTPPVIEPEATQPNGLQRFWWLAIPVLGLLAFVGLRPRSRPASLSAPVTTNVVQDSRSQLESKKNQLTTLLAELEPSLPSNPENQTEMVLLTNFYNGQRPEELATLRQNYTAALEKFKSVSAQASGENQRSSTIEQLAHYDALLANANEVKAFTQSLNDQWQALNRELAAIPDKLAALRGSLQQLKASYKERPDFLTADEVLKPLEEDISDVEKVQQANESLKALRMLGGVQDNIALVSDSINRLMAADNHLDTFEAQLPGFQTQGFKLYKFAERIPDVRQDMAIALGLIKQGEYKVLDAQVDAVVEQTSDVVDGATAFTELHKSNTERLEQVEKLGEEIKTHIDKSAETFATFNDFAPASWRDVRGNGTEAQNAANRAHELWEEASDYNALTNSQEFESAKVVIDQAFAELARAKTLLTAVDTRLQDLQKAKATAKEQLALVEKDIVEYQNNLRRPEVDREVGKQPEAKLSEATAFVAKARAELAQNLPDWLVVMQHVQAADRAADEATTLMRSEQEAMERRRIRVNSEKVEAQTSLQRVSSYLQVHGSEMAKEMLGKAEQLQMSYKDAEGREQSANTLREEMLGQTLEQTATLYDQIQQQGDALFVRVEKEFNDLETLRKEVAARVTTLQNRIAQVNSLIINAGLTPSPLQRQLYVITNSVPTLTSSQRSELEKALATVQTLENDLNQLEKEAQRDMNEIRQYRVQQAEQEGSNRDTYSWGGWGIPSPPRQSSPWGNSNSSGGSWWSGSGSSNSSRSSGSSWSSSSSSRSSSSSSSRSSSSSSRSSSWGGSGKKSGGGW
jgi:hypothetical protein